MVIANQMKSGRQMAVAGGGGKVLAAFSVAYAKNILGLANITISQSLLMNEYIQ